MHKLNKRVTMKAMIINEFGASDVFKAADIAKPVVK